ncbi:MAG: 5-(carboxyamino)imidazole ribonucleotide synthase, partial [Thermodesulfobacteriota bacterium]
MINGKSLTELNLGILGGGQLGKMLCQAASNWDLNTTVLDPSADCPSTNFCTNFIKGNFREYVDVIKLLGDVDLATIEIEHVNVNGLKYLEDKGVEVRPSPNIIEIIKDKGKQKTFYEEKNLPTSDFIICSDKDEVLKKFNEGVIKIPFV